MWTNLAIEWGPHIVPFGKHSQFAIENDHGFIVDLPIKSGGIFHCFCMFTGGVDQALL